MFVNSPLANHMKLRLCYIIHLTCALLGSAVQAQPSCKASFADIILEHKALSVEQKTRLIEQKEIYLNLANCKDKITPLAAAIMNNDLPLVSFLVGLGADVNQPSYNLWTPLVLAIRHRHNNIFFYLISKGALPELPVHGAHPAFFAVLYDNQRILKFYLSKGVDPNITYKSNTLLHQATQNGLLEASKVLLSFGANPYQLNQHGKTSVDLAVETKREDLVELFLGE